ncbi:MAG: deoxyguanosinetriphosphate triphosphohydrolase [Caldisericota bacterium]|nr:deoxyguanosinetriphosphate triphosphohydrolase [Caldisericota bacterium]
MLRQEYEKLETELFSPFATLSNKTKGRTTPETKDSHRTEFQRDVDRILYSKAFRRLQYKTQVFIAPKGDHYRNRLTHTLEVMTISRSISRTLRLNSDLTEAIALGHDLGHSPFGHAGEAIIDKKCKEYSSRIHFSHPEQSLRVVDILEKRLKSNGKTVFGLNLTYEVRNGILKHSKGLANLSELKNVDMPATLEGQIVRIADRIAYIHHDIDDAIRAKIINEKDIPNSIRQISGKSNSKRLSTMILDTIEASKGKDKICMSKNIENTMDELKNFLTKKVYIGSSPKKEEKKVFRMMAYLFDHYYNNPKDMGDYLKYHPSVLKIKNPIKYIKKDKEKRLQVICDYLSSMTDRFAIQKFYNITTPNPLPISD